ncbi:hypothetical protein ACFVYG_23910, partial [Streptomyces sp. NPDC058256]|uniref:hypothetical protein n=1 Tax=Streptomyces sp. NPDC058256 TaxID=3346408 RepID=UPI0036DFB1F6
GYLRVSEFSATRSPSVTVIYRPPDVILVIAEMDHVEPTVEDRKSWRSLTLLAGYLRVSEFSATRSPSVTVIYRPPDVILVIAEMNHVEPTVEDRKSWRSLTLLAGNYLISKAAVTPIPILAVINR